MQKKGNTIDGLTIKTDFTNKEYREVIVALTGKKMKFDASLQDFVREIVCINPNERRDTVQTAHDVIHVLQQAKQKNRGKDTAYDERSWKEVYSDIDRRDDLYNFTASTHEYIEAFEEYVKEGNHSRLDIQKALAVTLLRISHDMLFTNNKDQQQKGFIGQVVDRMRRSVPIPAFQSGSFGRVYSEMKKIGGCAGGGETGSPTSVLTIGGARTAKIGGAKEDESNWFNCPGCEGFFKPPIGDTCPGCGLTKQKFTDEGGVAC